MFADAQLQAGVPAGAEHQKSITSGQRSLTGFEQPGTRAIKTKKRSPPMLYEIAPFWFKLVFFRWEEGIVQHFDCSGFVLFVDPEHDADF